VSPLPRPSELSGHVHVTRALVTDRLTDGSSGGHL